MTDRRDVAIETAYYRPAEITPAEFEAFAVELLGAAGGAVDGLRVALHDKVEGVDGSYDFDATVRFEWGGMDFLVVVEAKRHKNPIKRELVQVLHAKLQSVGAQKATMIATAPYQRGALDYAKRHGIALATVTEGRYTFETKSAAPRPALSRQEAADSYGLPVFVAHAYAAGENPSSTYVRTLSTDDPQSVAQSLFGIDVGES